ncbi:MAG: hypothetical protein H7099_16910 [Gemmatimonadaceae bacterium]|nr:hypothetical protein [Gemmatimonadaceae bacterium]
MGFFKDAYSNQLIVSSSANALTNDMKKLRDMLTLKAERSGLRTACVELDIVAGSNSVDVYQTKALTKALTTVDRQSRLYILGHGDWKSQTVGGLNAEIWATRLIKCGLVVAPKIISIVGCNAGRDLKAEISCRVAQSLNSFASQLHLKLKDPGGLETMLFARPYTIRAHYERGKEGKTTHRYDGNAPKPVLEKKDGELPHGEQRKLCFCWVDGQQARKWVVYGQKETLEDLQTERDFGQFAEFGALPDFGALSDFDE